MRSEGGTRDAACPSPIQTHTGTGRPQHGGWKAPAAWSDYEQWQSSAWRSRFGPDLRALAYRACNRL